MNYRLATLVGLLLAFTPMIGWAQCNGAWKVLHYTETTGYNHNTKTQSLGMFNTWATANNYTVTNDDNGSEFNTLANLQQYAIVIFSNTSGDNGLDATQRANFEAYIAGGGSYLGIHAATDTYRHSTANGGSTGSWDWYAETVAGATVQQSPNHTSSSHNNNMTHQSAGHPTLASLPDPWNKTEEYYYWENGYLNNTFTELLRVGQTGGNSYDAPRMMAHCKNLTGGGRAFYTALGHDKLNFTSSANINFQNLIQDALLWAADPNIPAAATITISATTVADTCGNSTGEIDVSISGATSPTYSWDNGATSQDLTGLSAGDYILTVTDGGGCILMDTFTVDAVGATWKVLHYTETTGWNHNTKSQSLGMFNSWAAAEGYTVTNDDNGSEFNTLANLQQYAIVVFSNTSGDNGLDATQRANFEAYINGGGSYLGIHAASDTYRHSSANGGSKGKWDWYAESVAGATVQQSPNHTSSSHNNDMTKQVAGHPTLANIPDPWNKTEEYYYWENGYLNNSFTELLEVGSTGGNSYDVPRMMAHCKDLAGGGRAFYTALGHDKINFETPPDPSKNVTPDIFQQLVHDALLWAAEPNLCPSAASPLIITGTTVADTCDNSTGAINISVSGGTGSYTYSWSNGSTSEDQTGLSAGSFTVTVTDGGGLTNSANFSVSAASVSLTINFSVTNDITCPGGSDGELTASVSGGATPYQYLWPSTGSGNSFASGLSAGAYKVYVSDGNGCIDSASYSLTGPTAWNLNINETTEISCVGDADGKLTAVPSGGNGGNTFLWSTGSTSQTATGLSQGNYSVTVTDSKGCTVSGNEDIFNPPAIVISLTTTDETCSGAGDGSIVASVSGGAGGFSYSWSSGGNAATESGLSAGFYTLTVTDANSCEATATDTIEASDALFVQIDTTQEVLCAGVNNGILTASVSGGAPTYSFLWDNGDATPAASGLGAGSFKVVVTDGNGCKDSATAILSAPAGLIAAVTITDSIFCNGESTGGLQASASGGTPGYGYLWSNGATANPISGLTAGAYAVEITDANGCVDTAYATITEPADLVVTASVVQNVLCNGETNGKAVAAATGGTAPYSFKWQSGPSTDSLLLVSADTYKVYVTDANGCVDSAEVTLTEPAELEGEINTLTTITCFGGNNGALLASATGGSGGFVYVWADGPTGSSRTGLSAGTYTVYITDVNGCTDTVSTSLSDGTPVFVSIAQTTAVSCFGQTDGVLQASASGTTGSVVYTWNTGAGGATLSAVGAGQYIVGITDANGCSAADTIVVTAPAGVTAAASLVSDVSCFGGNDGSASGVGSGGTTPYTFSWSSGQTGTPVSGLSAGSYLLTVTDANGCQDTNSVIISEPASLSLTITETSAISCFGGSDGELTVAASGGVGTITYVWDGPVNGAVLSGVNAGTYQVIATDQNGCIDSASYTISDPTPISVSLAISNPISCFGGNDGAITATVAGGTPTYSYLWANGQTGLSATSLSVGTDTLFTTDLNGCIDTSFLAISEPSDISSSISETASILCFGDASGELTVTASGGTGSFTYVWSNAATSAIASGLPAGTYSVYVTDGNSCKDTVSYTISEPADLVVVAQVDVNVDCAGNATGSASATASGGTSSFSFLWSNGQAGATATGLTAGTYTIVVTDANGCQDSASVTLVAPNAIAATISQVSAITCFGGSDGSLSVASTGGSSPYTYVWSNSQTGPSISGLASGNYFVVATDAVGCTDSAFYTLTEPAEVQVTISMLGAISCNGATDGSLQATTTGGTGIFSYSWSTGATGSLLSGIGAGTYKVIATDGAGCIDSTTFTLTEPTAIVGSISETASIICFGGTNGELTASATGGTGPYSFFWDNGSIGAVDSGLGIGTYSVIITDAIGCADTVEFILTGPSDILLTPAADQNVSCHNGADGAASVTATGGTGILSFLWSNGQTSPTATGLIAGVYQVVVTDANGCQDSASVTISQPAPIDITISQTVSNLCSGDSSATLLVTATGGTGALTYLWNEGTAGATLTGAGAGTYTVYVTDASGCLDSASYTVNNPSPVVASVSITQVITCFGDNNGALLASGSGGSGGYTYAWSSGQSVASITGLTSGNYEVIVSDISGCPDTVSVSLTEPSELIATISVVTQVTCFGTATGELSVAATGGTGVVTYSWSNGQIGTSATGLVAGQYIVTATDANGCEDKDTVVLNDPILFTASATQLSPATCNAAGDGKAVVNVVGGASPFTYLWSNGQTTDTLENVGPGTYTVTVTGAAGCVAAATVNINNVLPWSATAVVVNDVSCFNGADGRMTAQITGGSGFGPFSYSWTNGQTTDTATILSAGIYTLTLSDGSGCIQLVSDTIEEPDPIVISQVANTDVSCFGGSDGTLQVSATGGTGSLSYSWDSGQSSASISGLAVGDYIVTVTDALGCTAKDTFSITQPTDLFVSLTPTQITCFNAANGSINSSVSGGTSSYTYLWSNGGSGTSISALTPASYQLVVTDALGCQDSASVVISQPTVVAPVAALTNDVSCFGGSDGAVSVSATGGNGSYSYSWNTGDTSSTLTGLVAGSYIVTATDGNGCTGKDTVVVSQPTDLVLTTTVVNNSLCAGGNTGKAYVTTSGGTAGYTYLWTGGATTDTVSALSAGTFQVIVTDAAGCQDSATVTITQPSGFIVSIPVSTQVSCFNGSNGSATALGSGGSSPYSYSWSSGAALPTATGLAAGTYQVTATDAGGCIAMQSVTITEPPILDVTPVIVSSISCFGANDGALSASATGGTAPYAFSWDNGQNGPNAINLVAGTYIAQVTDSKGCVDTTSILLSQPTEVVGTVTVINDVSCLGGNDGKVQANASGGNGTFTYLWSNGTTSSLDSTLAAGTHYVIITDGNGCTDSVSFSITEPSALIPTTSVVSNVSCFGANDGAASASASGGTGPYTFAWSNGQSGSATTGLSAGVYTVYATDANGCLDSTTVTITEPASLALSLVVDSTVSCFGISNGKVTVTVGGGTGPFSYNWSNGDTTTSASGLSAGLISVIVTDINGCQETIDTTLVDPAAFSASISITNTISCNGGTDGELTVTTSGGTPPASFLWSNGQTTSISTGLSAGLYSVTVTDVNGCVDTTSTTLTEPAPITLASVSVTDVSCFGGNNGSITIAATGGTGTLTYAWNNGQTGTTASTLIAGTYTVVVTDINGCVDSFSTVVAQPTDLVVTVIVDSTASCFGGNDGGASGTASGGLSPYTYQWTNGQIGPSLTGLNVGTYTLVVTDSAGCIDSASAIVTAPAGMTLTLSVLAPVSCSGGADGSALVVASGGVSPYGFLWNNGQTIGTATGLPAGMATVTVTDANGCLQVDSVNVPEPLPVVAAITVDSDLSCNGTNDGELSASATGGNGSYSYAWSNGQNGPSIASLGAGIYILTATDGQGCQDTAQVTLANPSGLVVTATQSSAVSCAGGADGAAVASASGGSGSFTFLWSTGQNTLGISGLSAGSYSVVVTDLNGCVDSASVAITEPSAIVPAASMIAGTSCNGTSDGTAVASATGGTSPYTYLWDNGQTNDTATALAVGVHQVVISDANGCLDSTTVTITEPSALQIAFSLVQPVSCLGYADGILAASTTGGTPGYTYSWQGGFVDDTLYGVGAGDYILTVSDANGCTVTDTFTLTAPPALAVTISTIQSISCINGANGSLLANPIGGTGTIHYTWSTTDTTASISGLSAGTYTVVVADDNGCAAFTSATLSDPTSGVSTSIAIIDSISCFGDTNGRLTATNTGGTAPYTGVWSTASTFLTINNLAPGAYSYIVTDSLGCSDTATVNLVEPDSISIQVSILSALTCADGNDGQLLITASGGAIPLSTYWNNFGTGDTLSGVGAGTYVGVAVDIHGCSVSDSIELVAPPAIIISSPVVTDVSCSGLSDGTISVSATGGTGSLSAAWSNGGTGTAITGLAAGTYTVTITDANGCVAIDSFTVAEPLPLVATVSLVQGIGCSGSTSGQISSAVSGGTANYTLLWSTGATAPTISGLGAGTYTLTATDANGCTATDSLTITQPDTLIATIAVVQDILCEGDTIGELSLNIQGGTPNFTTLWTGGASGLNPTGLSAGTYSVTVTDLSGCTDTASVTLVEPDAIQLASITVTNVTCAGASDGAISVGFTGGTGTLTTTWSNGSTGTLLSGLNGGVYVYTVTDANGCTLIDSLTVSEPQPLVVTVSLDQGIGCSGSTSGQVSSTVTGGVGTYSLLWNTSATTPTISGLGAGTYTLSVIDANGCTASDSLILSQPDTLIANISLVQPVLCAGDTSGQLAVIVTGGTPGFSYAWTGGAAGANPTGLVAGTYQVTVTDLSGCSDTASITLTDPAPVVISNTSVTNVSCAGANDGAVSVNISGGTGTLFTSWSNGASGTSISGLAGGSYILTVTDSNGCQAIDTFFIQSSSLLTISLTLDQGIGCGGASTGQISAQVNGGTSPLNLLWNNGATSPTISNLNAGTYTLLASDANGCTATDSLTITQPDTLIATITVVQDILCAGDTTGQLSLNIQGGTPNFTTLWTGGASGLNPTGLSAGTYAVTVTDLSGCTDTASVTLVEPDAIQLAAITLTNVSCAGAADGAISIGFSGGTGGLTTTWSNGATGTSLTGLAGGVYVYTVTDANGCSLVDSLTVSEPQPLVVAVSLDQGIGCSGNNSGQISSTVTGGVGSYSLLWNTSATTGTISNLGAGTYTLTVTDANGCVAIDSLTITQPDTLIATITVVQDILCAGDTTGQLSLNIQGGTPTFMTLWTGGASGLNPTGLSAGTYAVTVTDLSGCTDTASVTLVEPDAIQLAAITLTNVSCAGAADGAISIGFSGGTGTLTTTWSNGSTGTLLSGLNGGVYVYTVTDANGCSLVDSLTVSEPQPLVVAVSLDQGIGCSGNNSGQISSTVTGGVGSYSLLWNTSATTGTISNLGAGTYSLTVTDANGCVAIDSLTITQPDTLIATITVVQDILCAGDTTGQLSLNIQGGTPNFTTLWTGGASGLTPTGLSAGTYAVTVTDLSGCTDTASVTLVEPDAIQLAAITLTNVSCAGAADGAISIGFSGGTGGLTTTWSNGATGTSLTGLAGGVYVYTVTDANGCSLVDSLTVSEPQPLVVAVSLDQGIGCSGNNSGQISSTVTGGVGSYSLLWNTSATTGTISNLGAGTYTLTVTDANGCTATDSLTITQPDTLIATITVVQDILCAGDTTGQLSLNIQGGTPTFMTLWTGGASGLNPTGLSVGTYAVTVTDLSGCTDTASVTLVEPDAIQLTAITLTNVSCAGAADGAISIGFSGGTGALTTTWSSGSTGTLLSGLNGGVYVYTVTDANGCSLVDSLTVSEPQPLVVAVSLDQGIGCSGNNSGQISSTVTGGVGSYSLLWNTSATTGTISNLGAGTYSLTVTDANGCVAIDSLTITQPDTLIATITVVQDILCAGDTTGQLSLNIQGGTPNFTTLWTGGASGLTPTGLSAGTYAVTVTDLSGCTDTASVTLVEPSPIVISNVVITDVSCTAGNDGSITLAVSGGTGTLSTSWSNGGTGTSLSGISSGTYIITVTDANGCQAIDTFVVGNAAQLQLMLVLDQGIGCAGANTGQISAQVSGGTSPVSLLWSNGATTPTISGLGIGTYVLTASDVNGCSATDSLTLFQPDSLIASISLSQPVLCAGDSTAALVVNVQGGTPVYTYVWNSGLTGSVPSGLPAGTYSVTVLDLSGCSDTASIVITEPLPVQIISVSSTNVSCFGGNDGSISIKVAGGTGPLTASWSNGASGLVISGLTTGSYTVILSDSLGCQTTATYTIDEPTQLDVQLVLNQGLSCFGAQAAQISAQINGGVGPYTRLWSTGATTVSISGVGAGTYSLIVTDALGCLDTASMILAQPDSLEASIILTQGILCAGDSTATLSVAIAGGTGGLSYAWSGGLFGSTPTGVPAGSYQLTVTDNGGCTDTASIIVNDPAAIIISNPIVTDVSCFGAVDGSISVNISGGTGTLTASWSNGATGKTLTGLSAGPYILTVTDANGCQLVDSFQIQEPAPLLTLLTIDQEIDCFGEQTGEISSTVSGGTGSYSYLWNNTATTSSITNLSAGTYQLIVTDLSGCNDTATIMLTQPDSLSATMAITQEILCNGDLNGELQVTVSGGTSGYSFNWNAAVTGPNPTGLGTGQYFVVVTDLLGCVDTASAVLVEPDTLVAAAVVSKAISCPGVSDGEATASAIGGTGPYTFLWSNGQTTDVAINLSANTYTVVVTDQNGCTDTQTVTLITPALLQTTIQVVDPISCFGSDDGSLEVVVTGGTASYNYLWSNGNTGTMISNLAPGLYDVVITDGASCLDTASFLLQEPDSLITTTELVQGIICAGADEAIISASSFGGTGPFSYTWTPGGISDSLFNIGPGIYQVTVTDSLGCTANDSIIVTEPDSLILSMQVIKEIECFGGADGEIMASATGGAGSYTWFWTDGEPGDSRTGLTAGTYTAIVIDSLGCLDSIAVTLTEPASMILSLEALSPASCEPASNGSATVTITGGTSPFQYQWASLETQDTAFALSGGWQQLLVIDSAGCEAVDSVLIDTKLPWAATTMIVDTITCFGGTDGMAEVIVTGATGLFNFEWSNGEMTNPAIGLAADTTFVIVTDGFGCDTTVYVVMEEPKDMIVVGTVAYTDPGAANGAIRIDSVINGQEPFSYLWTPFATGRTISSLDTGLYQVVVTDGRGCDGNGSFTIGENKLDWDNFEGVVDCEFGKVFITWDVTEESGIDFFSIERSNDGLVYSRVAETPSMGDTLGLRSYLLQDSITPETSIMYRIRGHFFNGNSIETEPIDIAPCNVDSGYVDVFPVPVVEGDEVTVVFQTILSRETRVELRNALHQTLQYFEIPGPVGRQTVIFATEDLAAGHYYVVVSNGVEAYSARVLVTD